MNTKIGYVLTFIGSFLLGALYYNIKNRNKPTKSDNRTTAKQKDGKYFLVFNSVVVLIREVSKEQFQAFQNQYPNGVNRNVIDDFSTPPNRYTSENGTYFEYKWDPQGKEYTRKIEITKAEYNFETKKSTANKLMAEIGSI